jgi:hypothetical protein
MLPVKRRISWEPYQPSKKTKLGAPTAHSRIACVRVRCLPAWFTETRRPHPRTLHLRAIIYGIILTAHVELLGRFMGLKWRKEKTKEPTGCYHVISVSTSDSWATDHQIRYLLFISFFLFFSFLFCFVFFLEISTYFGNQT